MSDIIVRLLNFNSSVLTRKDSPDSSAEKVSTPSQLTVTETSAQEIRSCTVFSIIERLGPDHSIDQQLSALSCLLELPREGPILTVMTTPASLDLIKTFIQSEDAAVKANCFKYLHNLLSRTFDKRSDLIPDWKAIMNPVMPKDLSEAEKQELKDAKSSS